MTAHTAVQMNSQILQGSVATDLMRRSCNRTASQSLDPDQNSQVKRLLQPSVIRALKPLPRTVLPHGEHNTVSVYTMSPTAKNHGSWSRTDWKYQDHHRNQNSPFLKHASPSKYSLNENPIINYTRCFKNDPFFFLSRFTQTMIYLHKIFISCSWSNTNSKYCNKIWQLIKCFSLVVT